MIDFLVIGAVLACLMGSCTVLGLIKAPEDTMQAIATSPVDCLVFVVVVLVPSYLFHFWLSTRKRK